MNIIAIYTITSGLHDEESVRSISDSFLSEIFPTGKYDFRGADFGSFGEHPLNLIYVRTGGAEGIFKGLLPGLLDKGIRRFYLLTSGKSNSLAASLEILSFLRQNGLHGEVLHGGASYLQRRIGVLAKVEQALLELSGKRIGVIGRPSDWLIASGYDPASIRAKIGVETEDIPMCELTDALAATIASAPASDESPADAALPAAAAMPGAQAILAQLRVLIDRNGLGALTLRCFDLLGSVGNTGCLALATLNGEGFPSSCEGDVPALLSMMISRALTGHTGFQANPARINVETGEILFAHCTIPLDIVDGYCFDTHFESGIGVGIHGNFPEGPVTVFKVDGALGRCFVAEGVLLRNQYEDNLCRTQIVVRLSPEDAQYFLKDPIGNHHIILPGHYGDLLREFMNAF